MMMEARLILDVIHTERAEGLTPGMYLRNGREFLWAGDQICKTFGGFTCTPTMGCWRNGSNAQGEPALELDTSVTFTCAIEAADYPLFRDLAILLAAGQKTVYVVSPMGVAEILPVPPFIVGEKGELRSEQSEHLDAPLNTLNNPDRPLFNEVEP